MTTEQQNIAIAKACGWTKRILKDSQWECGSHSCQHDTHIRWVPPEDGESHYIPTLHEGQFSFPNYNSSLDAMHEAEKVLSEGKKDWSGVTELQWTYYQHLGYLVYEMGGGSTNRPQDLAHATAATRAWALLKTLGLWED